MSFTQNCPVCGGADFAQLEVLWPALIDAWELSEVETNYVNRQQGFHCKSCGNNLRAMGIGQAILNCYEADGPLSDVPKSIDKLDVLEINRAGSLTSTLALLQKHRLIEFPEFDMQKLDIPTESYDLVLHSDTLEHVEDPVLALSECRRILKVGGRCIYSVPIIVDRLNRSRAGLSKSFHGQSGIDADDQQVWTEFGADAWKTVIKAGFESCEIYAFEFPASLVLIARKRQRK